MCFEWIPEIVRHEQGTDISYSYKQKQTNLHKVTFPSTNVVDNSVEHM